MDRGRILQLRRRVSVWEDKRRGGVVSRRARLTRRVFLGASADDQGQQTNGEELLVQVGTRYFPALRERLTLTRNVQEDICIATSFLLQPHTCRLGPRRVWQRQTCSAAT